MGKSAVAERVRHVGEVAGPKAREVREAIGPKVIEVRDAVAPKVKQARRKVGFWIAGEEPRKARKWPAFAAVGIGAAVAFFLDPVSGKRRRMATKDWARTRLQAIGGRTERDRGVRMDDETLGRKVENEVLENLDIPSGQIDFSAEDGIVVLRGAVKRPRDIVEIERLVWDIGGVVSVKNMLHLEGTPAPMG